MRMLLEIISSSVNAMGVRCVLSVAVKPNPGEARSLDRRVRREELDHVQMSDSKASL